MDDVHLEGHVLVHEVGQLGAVGGDATHLGGGEEDVLGLLLREEGFYVCLARKVEFCMGFQHQIIVAFALQFPYNGTTYHAPVPRHVNFAIFLHKTLMILFY